MVLEVDKWSQRGLGWPDQEGWSPKNPPVSGREQPSGNAEYVPYLEAGRKRGEERTIRGASQPIARGRGGGGFQEAKV